MTLEREIIGVLHTAIMTLISKLQPDTKTLLWCELIEDPVVITIRTVIGMIDIYPDKESFGIDIRPNFRMFGHIYLFNPASPTFIDDILAIVHDHMTLGAK